MSIKEEVMVKSSAATIIFNDSACLSQQASGIFIESITSPKLGWTKRGKGNGPEVVK